MPVDFLDRETRSQCRVGVIGYRSWIAQHLISALETWTAEECHVVLHEKEDPAESTSSVDPVDFSNLDCLYVFPGRSRPTAEDMERERILVSQIIAIPRERQPRRIVCLGSLEPYFTAYGEHKRWVEETLLEAPDMCDVYVVRAPAIFGPGQPIEANMLVPSLAREGSTLELRCPDLITRFIFVWDLVAHLVRFADRSYNDVCWSMSNRFPMDRRHFDLPGTFTLTPKTMRDLYLTWESYR